MFGSDKILDEFCLHTNFESGTHLKTTNTVMNARVKYFDGLLPEQTLKKRDQIYLTGIFSQINACNLKKLTVLTLDKSLSCSKADDGAFEVL